MADDVDEAQRGERIGVALREPILWHDLVQLAETAEETGYEACFVPEITGREAFATLAGLAGVTHRLVLGTGVVPMHARRAVVTAMAAATVHDLSGGRLILGLGTGPPAPGALDRLRSYVAEVRTALEGRPFTPGDAPGSTVELSVVPRPAPPLWIAALGERAFTLAGEIADGVLLNWCTPERVRVARDIVVAAATRAGRDPAGVAVGVYVRANLADEEPVALEALKPATAQYALMPHYRRQLEEIGLASHAGSAVRAVESGDLSAVPEELVRELCLVGDPAAARGRLEEFRAAGADLPIVYPVPGRDAVSSMMGTVLAVAPTPVLEP